MAYEFKFPDVGQGITEGTIVRWHVKEGDAVKEDQVIVEIETDKAVVEVPSPKSGVILKRHKSTEGQEIRVGETIVVIGEKGEKASTEKEEKKKQERKAVEEKGAAVVGAIPETMEELEHPQGEVLATLAVRKLAKELRVNLSSVKGTGVGGKIAEEDVRKTASGTGGVQEKPAVKVQLKHDMWGMLHRENLSGIRKIMAEKMALAHSKAALLTNFDEADATKLDEQRKKMGGETEKQGAKLTFMPFIVRATVEALKKNTCLNSSLDEKEQQIIIKEYYNIGVAVSTEHGLMVPVIKGANFKDIIGLAIEIKALAEKATTRKIDFMDLQGGSFTVSNLGALGGTFFTPIVNYPESAILGIGRVAEKPVAVNGKIEVRKIMPLSLSYDHRVIDGAQAAQFLNDFKKLIEEPEQLSRGADKLG